MSKLQEYLDNNLSSLSLENFEEKTDELISLGNKIKVVRKSKNISQKELSKLTGISQANLSKLEKGKLNVTVRQLKRIADGLGAKLEIEVN